MTTQHKAWCFTLNNYTEDDYDHLKTTFEKDESITYAIIGRETGEGGTPHLQGYIEFKRKKTFNGAKKIISDKAHLESRRGNAQEASEYCQKENNFWETGKGSFKIER